MAEREQFEQTSTERLAKRIRDILGPYNDDTESLQNLISKLVLEREEYFDRIGQLEQAARAAPALPQIPEGMALVPVSKLRDAERYAWLKENCGERLTRRSLLNEFSEHKTEYIFPSLIAWADFCGQITLDEAIDFKIEAAKEPQCPN